MVASADIRKANASHYKALPLVAVFIGGTQGIGRYAVEALADLYSSQVETSLRVYIVGRRKAPADEVLQACRRLCPRGEFTFVQAEDVALMKDLDATAAKIAQLEQDQVNPRIDLLVQTQAQILFGARTETKEGLGQLMSLFYYSRIRFATRLMPLLERSTHGARVVSVDAAGMEHNLFRSDLSLRSPANYSYRNVKSHAAYMTTMAFEHLASQHNTVSFVYMYPGVVLGPSYRDSSLPWWFKACFTMLEPLLHWAVAIRPEDSGSRTLFFALPVFASAGSNDASTQQAKGTDGTIGSGCYAVGPNCDITAERKHADLYPRLRSEGFQQEVWAHTIQIFDDVKAGRRM